MKLVPINRHNKPISEEERKMSQAALDENRPFAIISKRRDGRWEVSCWLPDTSVKFYEILGAVEMLKDNIKELYLDDENE
jgi:hypothetical protein